MIYFRKIKKMIFLQLTLISIFFIGINFTLGADMTNCENYEFNDTSIILYVGGSGPGNYSTIQDAIDDAENGYLIYVYAGIYYEKLFINKSINLIGEGKNCTIIDNKNCEFVVNINSNLVKLNGFTIQNSSKNGLNINASDFLISNNIFKKNGYLGISVKNCNCGFISDNTIKHNERGLCFCCACKGAIVCDNLIESNNYCGIYVYLSENNTFCNNSILCNKCGLILSQSNNNILSYNHIEDCKRCNIFLYSSWNNNITHNNLLKGTLCAFFSCCKNHWDGNFWNKPRLFPKLIFGVIKRNFFIIPSFDFDYHPVKILN
jgi:parallel beta-helix repeat protein